VAEAPQNDCFGQRTIPLSWSHAVLIGLHESEKHFFLNFFFSGIPHILPIHCVICQIVLSNFTSSLFHLSLQYILSLIRVWNCVIGFSVRQARVVSTRMHRYPIISALRRVEANAGFIVLM
jgi:hypothetical protein